MFLTRGKAGGHEVDHSPSLRIRGAIHLNPLYAFKVWTRRTLHVLTYLKYGLELSPSWKEKGVESF